MVQISSHRFTAGYVAELIRNGFRQPHRLLNAYVQHFTKFSISDADKYVEHEEQQDLPKLSQYRLDFSKLRESEFEPDFGARKKCSYRLHRY